MRCPHYIITACSLAASKLPDSGVEITAAPVACKAFVALRTPPCAQHPHQEGCTLEEATVWPSATPGLYPGYEQQALTCLNEDSLWNMMTSIMWQGHFPPRAMHSDQLLCVPVFLLALLACCWESPVWSCHPSENIYIPAHWEDLIKWTRFPCMAVGSFIMLFSLSDLRGVPALSCGIYSLHPSRLGTPVDL